MFTALGDVSDQAGLFDDAAQAYRAARRHVEGDAVREAGLMLKEGIIGERSGRWVQATRWYRRALGKVQDVEARTAAVVRGQICVYFASIRRQQAKLTEAQRWCRLAVDEGEASGDGCEGGSGGRAARHHSEDRPAPRAP